VSSLRAGTTPTVFRASPPSCGDWLLQSATRTPRGRALPRSQSLAEPTTNDRRYRSACSRSPRRKSGAQFLNDLALAAIFGSATPLAVLPEDLEMNLANCAEREVHTGTVRLPMPVPMFKHAQLHLAKNTSKKFSFVNGMSCTVEAYCPTSYVLQVRTKTHERLVVFLWKVELARASLPDLGGLRVDDRQSVRRRAPPRLYLARARYALANGAKRALCATALVGRTSVVFCSSPPSCKMNNSSSLCA
jgi:hypothetical protein